MRAHFPLGSSQGLVNKLYSLGSSSLIRGMPATSKGVSSCGHLCSPIRCATVTCWTWSSSWSSPCVFRQAAWAIVAWLPCRLKGDLTCHLWERSEYPVCTDCWCFTHPIIFIRLAELLNPAHIILFFWQKSFMEICIFKNAS